MPSFTCERIGALSRRKSSIASGERIIAYFISGQIIARISQWKQMRLCSEAPNKGFYSSGYPPQNGYHNACFMPKSVSFDEHRAPVIIPIHKIGRSGSRDRGAVQELPQRCRERPPWRSVWRPSTDFKWFRYPTGTGQRPFPTGTELFLSFRLTLPAELTCLYDSLLTQLGITMEHRPPYGKWLRYYWDFCPKGSARNKFALLPFEGA